jgi:ribosomal protein L22
MADSDEPKPPRRRAAAKKTAAAAAEAASSSSAQKPAAKRTRATAKKTAGAAAEAASSPSAQAPAATRTRAAAKKPPADKAAEAKPVRSRAVAKKPAGEPAATTAAAEVGKAAGPAAAKTRRRVRRGAPAKESAKPVPVAFTVRAQARYVRSSARKARLVCDHIRGKSVPEARAVLAFAPRGVAKDWAKLLDSAIANAENNHELVGDELHVTTVYADEGPTLKRFTPRAMGRATPIHKRTSHLTIMLGPKE